MARVGGVQVVKFSLNSFMTLGLAGKFTEEILQVSSPFQLLVADEYFIQLFACYYTGRLLECIRGERER